MKEGDTMKINVHQLTAATINSGMSKKKLGQTANVSEATITRIFRGENEVQMVTISKLAKALKIDYQQIIEND